MSSSTTNYTHPETALIGRLLGHPIATQKTTGSAYTGWWRTDSKNHPKLFGKEYKPTDTDWTRLNSVFGLPLRRQLTSYPFGEIALAINFASTYGDLKSVVAEIHGKVDCMSSTLSHRELFALLDDGLSKLLPFEVHSSIQIQVRRELRLQLYRELLHKEGNSTRILQIADNTCRDAAQSAFGKAWDVDVESELIQIILSCGLPFGNIESGGGAFPQLGMLPNLVGDHPVLPFEQARRCMLAQRAVIEQQIVNAGAKIDDPAFNELFKRFTVATGDDNREFLSRERVCEILDDAATSLNCSELSSMQPIGQTIIRLYFVKQNYLFRGKFGFALGEIPEPGIRLLVRQMHQSGCDILRVFDGLNYLPNITPAIQAAVDAGMLVQPVLHADPHFAPGIDGFVSNMHELIRLCGKRLEAIVVKDAPGIVDPEFAFNIAKRLTQELDNLGLAIPLVFHTHENSGYSILSCLEFMRGCGSKQTVRIECDFGKGVLSSPNGQPDIADFLHIVMGTSWQPETSYSYEEAMERAEKTASQVLSYAGEVEKSPIELTTELRLLAIEAGLPGGMTGTYCRTLVETATSFAKVVDGDSICTRLGVRDAYIDGNFSDEGRQFLQAYLRACLQEMILVNAEMGFVSRVTPVSQYIGAQAKSNVDSGIGKGFYDYRQVDGQWMLVQNASYNRKLACTLSQPVKNHYIVLATTADLQIMYPKADRELIRQAFSGLTVYKEAFQLDVDLIERSIPLDPNQPINTHDLLAGLGLLEKVRELSGRPSIDVEVLSAADNIMRSENRERLLNELASHTLHRAEFITVTHNPLFMDETELGAFYNRDELTLIDFIMLVCFTQANLGRSFITRRETAISTNAPHRVLANMGVFTFPMPSN